MVGLSLSPRAGDEPTTTNRTMASSLGSALRRSSAIRQRSLITAEKALSAWGGEKVRGPSPEGENGTPLGRAVAGALAVCGVGLGVLFLPSPTSFVPQFPVAFCDSDLAQCDLDPPPRVLLRDVKQETKARFLFRDSYRRRVFFNYEKRLRMRSPPEKIFEYFASYQSSEGEIFMSAADLMRATVPVFPPSGSNIVREGHLRGERSPGELQCAPSTFFMLFDTNNDGFISFPEYIFFVTLLSIPESSFSVAFKMFDQDNNGQIEREEFKKVMTLMRSFNRQGTCHSDGRRIGLKVHGTVENGGLVEYFFGKDGKECLQHDKFVRFLKELHDEILRLEFAHYDFMERGSISAKDFALSMIASADMKHINKFLDRVEEFDNIPNLRDMRITFEEFKAFAELRKKLQPLALAIFSYGKVNGMLTKQDFIRATSHVCGAHVTANMVDVIFHVFDGNRDGNLSSEEFLRALQYRETDIRQPNTTGIVGFLSCLSHCSKNWSFPWNN